MRNTPEVMVSRRAAVASVEAAGVDGLASEAVVARGEAVGGDDLASVVGRGGAAGPVGIVEEIPADDTKDILQGPWEGAENAVTANGCRGAGVEGAVRTRVSTGDICRAQSRECVILNVQVKALGPRYVT